MPRPPFTPASPGHRPTAAELRAAQDRLVPDVAVSGLRVLFCGINPSLYSAAAGRHFARPGNRFWPVLHRAGFTPRRLAPWESDELLRLGYGITNVVRRATATAAELDDAELRAGGRQLRARVRRLRPRALAVLGIGAYRHAFGRPEAGLGPQPERLGDTLVWVLPNPSGLNAHYGLESLAGLFEELRRHVETDG